MDLLLLREFQDCQDALARNLAALKLPVELQAIVEKDPAGLTSVLERARRLRDAIMVTGNTPDRVGENSRLSTEPLVAAAKLLYPPGRKMEQLRAALQENLAALGLPKEYQTRVEQDGTTLDTWLEAASRLRVASTALGINARVIAETARSHGEVEQMAAADCCRSAKAFQAAWIEYTKLAGSTPVAAESTSVVHDATQQAGKVMSHRALLKQWTAWIAARRKVEALGMPTFVEAVQANQFSPTEALKRFEIAYARWWLPSAVDNSETLRMFQRFRHEDAIRDFQELDELARKTAATRALHAVYHDLPPSDQVPRKSELGLLRHQMGLKRPSKSIRELISGMPQSFGKLAPCLLMSPLSISQYLPADQAQFDVVVFDEASQIATWDAIGAIARGKQTIIVGDPKQLPPTNFFGKAENDEENDQLDDFEKDLESILDEAQASGLPTLQLNWHYRSRHESLIAFSNYNYYGNNLVTFPAAESNDRGVSLTLVKGGLYDRGKSRTNRAEAEEIVADAVSRMRGCLGKPEHERLTYGVVTFNSQQQSLIQDLFDQALRDAPELEWFFAEERIEPTAVKNLENVQGDERDVMYFSITFGKDAAGKFPIDFGAINRNGGERRLNVAVTRARQALLVYASFLPDELRAERSSARGVHDLKAFLEYAYKGTGALTSRTDGSVGDIESPFEQAVADALERRGWRLDPQVGVSGFRVDLGVIHPERPGAYLAGIECDGATYHRSAAARDRDKTRQKVLENLGWNILRVWSSDWWYDSDTAIRLLDQQLSELLQAFRNSQPVETGLTTPEPSHDSIDDLWKEPTQSEEEVVPPTNLSDASQPTDVDSSPRLHLVAKHVAAERQQIRYQVANLPDATHQQARFFDEDYSQELRQMAQVVIETEAPVRDDVLAKRIARAHGFARTGPRIKDRVMSVVPEVTATTEDAGRFLWATPEPAAIVPFRHAAPNDERRSLDEIPIPELLGLLDWRPDVMTADDPAIALAREMGLGRLSKTARERLEYAIELTSTSEQ